MTARTARRVGVGVVSAICAVGGLASPAAAAPTTSERVKLRSGNGALTVSWRIGCRDWERAGDSLWRYTMFWDPAVRESGQTKYAKVRLAYKHRRYGETFIDRTVVVDVRRRNAVVDPPEHRARREPYDERDQDGYGPGVRVSVSEDGSRFRSVYSGPILDCDPPQR